MPEPEVEERCRHSRPASTCVYCAAEAAPKCKHGNPFFCGFCFGETGDGEVE